MADETLKYPEGEYVRHGDVLEWQWKDKGPKVEPEVKPVKTTAKRPAAKKPTAKRRTARPKAK